jgi:hypothetical protein
MDLCLGFIMSLAYWRQNLDGTHNPMKGAKSRFSGALLHWMERK